MVRYSFDLYPRTDPRDGSLIARLSDLQRAEYRGEANGAGVGLLSLRGDTSDGILIDPAGLQYVRVVSDDTNKVVGGYFLDKGDFAAITKQNSRLLTFSGAGTLSYLDREVMWSRSYIEQHPNVFGDQAISDPKGGVWPLFNQGDHVSDGDFLGAVLWRIVWEAQHFDNADDKDRPESAIPDLVLTFDGFEDTDGNPWTLPSGEFTADVGESVYQVTQRIMRAGIYVEMDPDTFELRAWEAAGHRRDRSGSAFGASVVRFSAGENIKSDAKRKIAAYIKRTAILASTTEDLAAVATAAGDIPWHGSIRDDVGDEDALEQLAESQIARRSDASDVLRLRLKLGASPSTGLYRPWEEVLPDDIVTVDSGSGQWDWDEVEFPVAALEVKLREEGDWDAFVELGSSFSDLANREFQAAGVPHHSHPPDEDEVLGYLESGHRFLITAHRGDIGSDDSYPENTLEAIRQAARKGADRIECDVWPSSEDTFYVIHDEDVSRTTDGTGNITAKTDAAINALNIDGGYGYSSARHGTSLNVPTLHDVFVALRHYDISMQIQLFSTSSADAVRLARICELNGTEMRVVIEVPILAQAQAIKKYNRRIATMMHHDLTGATGGEPDVNWLSIPYADAVSVAWVDDLAPQYPSAYITINEYSTADQATIMRDMFARGIRAMTVNHLDDALATKRSILYGGAGSDSDQQAAGYWEPAVIAAGYELMFLSNGDVAMIWRAG